MKQVYVKPRMIVERFALSQSIALNCGISSTGSTLGKPNSGDSSTCGWDVGGEILFLAAPICTKPTTDEMIGSYCYNNPNPESALFSSF